MYPAGDLGSKNKYIGEGIPNICSCKIFILYCECPTSGNFKYPISIKFAMNMSSSIVFEFDRCGKDGLWGNYNIFNPHLDIILAQGIKNASFNFSPFYQAFLIEHV